MKDILMIVEGVGMVGVYFALFFLWGCLFPAAFHGNRIRSMLILGFLSYFSAFHLLCLPMKLLHFPLHVLTISWMAVQLGVLVICLLMRRSVMTGALGEAFRAKPDGWLCFIIIFAAGLTLLLGINVNHVSDYDAGYYIGYSVSSVYSDSIELMDPYNGKMLEDVDPYYRLNTFTNHSAVIYQTTKLPPLIEEKFSMTMALCILYILVLYRTGEFLFPKKRENRVLFVWFCLLAMFFSYSISGASHYFAYRTYEGKSIAAYLLLGIVFCASVAVLKKAAPLWGFCCLFFAGLCGIGFCNTACVVIPVMTVSLLFPSFILDRQWKNLLYLILILLPSVFWILLRFLLR